ncbi:ROK family protein [Streptomyces sp. NPDC047028]|uniref:ROK family protein n=1 Tax=Streptomyces sp. NPDC047028 TaxID=3155793 RepID=UPI0033C0ED66
MADRPAPADCVIALDVGGTAMKGALLDRTLSPLTLLHLPTPRHAGPGAVVAAIAAALVRLAERAEDLGHPVRHAATVVPGIVDESAGLAVHAANIGWRDLPLAERLGEALGRPVVLGHDVRAGGLAESRVGAARGISDVVFVPVGTGIAAALVYGGRVLRGLGHAGELGHVVVDPDGPPCACGSRGCLETVASATAVAAAYTARSGRGVAGAAEVAALVTRRDPHAVAVWDTAVDALATAFALVSTVLAPERIVVGGGLAEAGELLLSPLRARLERRLTFQARPSVVRAGLGDRAGCLGAGLLAWQAVGYDPAGAGPAADPVAAPGAGRERQEVTRP